MKSEYLSSIIKHSETYKTLAEKTLDRIPEDMIQWEYNEVSNSIGVIVKHISGNMLSRWTDFLTTDGEKEWRHRDSEFENDIHNKKELMKKWNEGWKCYFKALNSLKEEDLKRIILIRNEEHTVEDAINRQLAHYSYHIGQIVYLAKLICGEDWISLSVPKGKSKEFNLEKFAKT
jgi:hypothetical protein